MKTSGKKFGTVLFVLMIAGLAGYDAMDGEAHNPIRGLGGYISGTLLAMYLIGLALVLIGMLTYSEVDGKLDWDKKSYWVGFIGVALLFGAALAARFT